MRDHDFEAHPKSPRAGERTFKHSGDRERDEAFGWQETDPGVKPDADSGDRRHVTC